MASNTCALGPQEPTLPCLEPSCIHHFYNRTGRSNHMRSKHPRFVPDLQQPANAPSPTSSDSIPSSQMSSPPSYNTDELLMDDLNLNLDISFDGGEYQHLNGGNQSPELSNARSHDRAPSNDPTVPCINRTYHPIIDGEFFQVVLLMIFHIYSQIHFRDNL